MLVYFVNLGAQKFNISLHFLCFAAENLDFHYFFLSFLLHFIKLLLLSFWTLNPSPSIVFSLTLPSFNFFLSLPMTNASSTQATALITTPPNLILEYDFMNLIYAIWWMCMYQRSVTLTLSTIKRTSKLKSNSKQPVSDYRNYNSNWTFSITKNNYIHAN